MSPIRIWRIFRLLLSFYLLIKRRDHFLGVRPLEPEPLVASVVALGSSFVKLVQVLATRNDFFEERYLCLLRTIHDDLPPMSFEEYQRVLARGVDMTLLERIDPIPIASASIGQVHEGWLHDGTHVAIKLRRDGIERRVRHDIRIIEGFNTLFRPLFSPLTRHSVESVIREFGTMIVQECNMRHECHNLEQFRAMYAHSGIRFPFPYASSEDALVMSFEQGFRFDDREAIGRSGIAIGPIMDRLVHFYTEQMLVQGFFHADPHPGNLLISPQGELILLDFGMLKRVSHSMRIAIIELIRAAHERDYESYVSAAKRMGTIAYDAPESELAEFTERMFAIFGNDVLDSGSMQQLAFEVLEQTRSLPFKLPQEAIYILRVSAIIEGLGTTYIENFNGIKDILPILERNIPRALGIKGSLWENLRSEIQRLPDDFAAARETLRRASRGELRVEISPAQMEHWHQRSQEALRPMTMALSLALGAMGGWIAGYPSIALVLITLAIARLWWHA